MKRKKKMKGQWWNRWFKEQIEENGWIVLSIKQGYQQDSLISAWMAIIGECTRVMLNIMLINMTQNNTFYIFHLFLGKATAQFIFFFLLILSGLLIQWLLGKYSQYMDRRILLASKLILGYYIFNKKKLYHLKDFVIIKQFLQLYHYNSLIMKSQKSENQSLLYNHKALKLFLPYLKLSDLLASATISKEWQYNIKKYIKESILPHPFSEATADVFQTTRMVFNRKVVLREPTLEGKEIDFPEICNQIQIGNHVTKFGTVEGNFYLIKNNKLATVTKKDWKDPASVYKLEPRFQNVHCVGSYVYMIGDSQIVRYTTTVENMFTQETKIEFQGILDNIVISISAILLILSNQNNTSDFLFLTHKEPIAKKVQINIPIESPSTDITLDFGTHGFVLSEGSLYQADFENEKVKFTEVKAMKGKNICKLMHGNKHYFAYQRKKKLIKKWTNAQVLNWAEQEGFDGYLKILEAEKVTGEKLLTMNKTYMEDVLGITSTLTQQKMNLLIQENNKNSQKFQDYIVHCWGKNDKGQLCVNPSANISNPIKLKLPEDLQLYTCFCDHTVLLNSKTNQLTMNQLDQQGKLKWQRIADNKVWAICGYKNSLLVCSSVGKKRIPQAMSQEPIHIKKQKLRTAKNIMDQIQWDTNLKKEDFSVGYTSRYEGTLECGFEQFIKSDVKENSILYFKKGGKLVWDKKTRLDIL